MEKNLKTVLDYFSYFSYSPTFDEIYIFFPKKIAKKALLSLLNQYIKQKRLFLVSKNESSASHQSIGGSDVRLKDPKDTLPQYSIRLEKNGQKENVKKINWLVTTVKRYISILKRCPFVQFVGVTGSSAMIGIRQNKDIDLCIVSKSGTIWITRFIAIVLAKMLKIHSNTGVCLNLFFDETDLRIPDNKHNTYIAHELLQMRPVCDKKHIYEKFLNKNNWIFHYFPNAETLKNKDAYPTKYDKRLLEQALLQSIDLALKHIQLPIINRNKTSFFITDTQLWLFKNDFEKRLKQEGLVI